MRLSLLQSIDLKFAPRSLLCDVPGPETIGPEDRRPWSKNVFLAELSKVRGHENTQRLLHSALDTLEHRSRERANTVRSGQTMLRKWPARPPTCVCLACAWPLARVHMLTTEVLTKACIRSSRATVQRGLKHCCVSGTGSSRSMACPFFTVLATVWHFFEGQASHRKNTAEQCSSLVRDNIGSRHSHRRCVCAWPMPQIPNFAESPQPGA